MTIDGYLGKVRVGDNYAVRVMGIINLSEESFYKDSIATSDQVLARARSMIDEGADILDLGAVSTAPGSKEISCDVEMARLIPSLKMLLDNVDIEISVDTQRAKVANEALRLGASCINDVSCLKDDLMAKTVANYDASLILMASKDRPGDILKVGDIICNLESKTSIAESMGVSSKKIVMDPGVGRWIPEKTTDYDLSIIREFYRLRSLDKPLMAAVSRKSFIGSVLGLESPVDRLAGSLASAAIAVFNGAHVVRTHDVKPSIDIIKMAESIRGKRVVYVDGCLEVEVTCAMGHPTDGLQEMKHLEVGEGGDIILAKKGCYRSISVKGLSSLEAVIIKQEMLARGGDAAMPKSALRCDPLPKAVIILGNLVQIKGLIKKLKVQPFNLPRVSSLIETALAKEENDCD